MASSARCAGASQQSWNPVPSTARWAGDVLPLRFWYRYRLRLRLFLEQQLLSFPVVLTAKFVIRQHTIGVVNENRLLMTPAKVGVTLEIAQDRPERAANNRHLRKGVDLQQFVIVNFYVEIGSHTMTQHQKAG